MSSKSFARIGASRWLLAAVVAGAGLLASCGGGGQIVPFVPTRVLAFGDDLSTLEADGRKYSINAFRQVTASDGTVSDDPTTLDCLRNPLWVQTVAAGYGLAFDRCLGTATTATGQALARNGHKVADFAAQIASVQGNALGEHDLALVMLGMNDILELYAQYPTLSRADLIAAAQARGTALGGQINQLALRGPAVVVLTVPDIGLSPFAQAQNTSSGDATRSALISELTRVFNDRMSLALINDGRLIGLVYADIEVQNHVKFAATFGLVNVVAGACTTALPGCTSATLVPANATTGAAAASAATWLWADNLRLSPFAQGRLGQLANARARGNPF